MIPASPPKPGDEPVVNDVVRDSSARSVLRRLEIDVTQRLDGLLHGNHRGLVPGQGTEQGDTRLYAPGDDTRMIDWAVTARLNEPYIRQTIAERELRTWLVIDRSARLDFGTVRAEKRDLVFAAAGAFGFLTARDGNRIGAILAGRGGNETVPMKSGRRHLLHLLDQVAADERRDGSGATDLASAIGTLIRLARRRSLVVIISDFFVTPGWEQPLRVLSHRHDVIAVQVTDPLEHELPDVGVIPFTDPATGRTIEIDTSKASLRERYAAAARERQDKLETALRSARTDLLTLSTDSDWLSTVVEYAVGRSRRSARAGRAS